MTVHVETYDDSVVFITDGYARLVYEKPNTHDKIGSITTDGTWLVSTKDIDELIAVLTSIRYMLNDKS